MSRIDAVSGRGRFRFRWPRAWRTPLGIIGAVIAGAWIVVAFTAQWWVPFDPLAQVLPRLQAPGIDTLLGTDALGRDIFSRLMTGATVTIPLALMLVIAAMIIGTAIGALAGYFGGWVDETLMRITDLVMAFPTVILAMVVAASLGPSLFNAVIAAIVVSWPQYARVTRSIVLGLRAQNYVIAGRLLGHSPLRTLFIDIAPEHRGSDPGARDARHRCRDPAALRALLPRARCTAADRRVGIHDLGCHAELRRLVARRLPRTRDPDRGARVQLRR